MANGKKTDQQRITATERRIKTLAYRKAGASYRAIADALSVSLATVHDDMQRAYAELQQEQNQAADDARTLENVRLDDLQAAVWQQARGGNLKAIGTVLRIMERRARLNGLDAQPGMILMSDLEITLRWHDDNQRIIDITPAADNHAAAAPQLTESGSTAPSTLPYRVRWSEMGQEQASSDAEPENGA